MFNLKKLRKLQRDNSLLKYENEILHKRLAEHKATVERLQKELDAAWEREREAYIRHTVKETCKG